MVRGAGVTLVALLVAVVVAVLAGCSSVSATAPEAPTPAVISSTVPPPRLPAVPAWAAPPGETQAGLKTTATQVLQAAGSWDGVGAGSADAVLARSGLSNADPDDPWLPTDAGSAPPAGTSGPVPEATAEAVLTPLAALSALADPAATSASVEVLYPQLGGLQEQEASVMVGLTQHLVLGTAVISRAATFDVRLHRAGTGTPWAVSAVYGGPTPSTAVDPSDPAAAVAGRDTIALTGAAAGDVHAGLVDDAVLEVLLDLAGGHSLGVSVFVTGHPWEVFGTDRQSNHSRGRAVDIWSINGFRVDDPRLPREVVTEVMLAGGAAGATEVGGPVDPNGAAPGYFSDALHADHIHIGLTPGKPSLGASAPRTFG